MTAPVFAPAKINLTLRVGPPRPDGRHPLDSLVSFTQRCGDSLDFDDAGELSLTIQGPFAAGLSTQSDNLVLQAARLLRDYAGVTKGAAIKLVKNLPVASGIGGGSADAAGALIGLNDLWGVGASRENLQSLGATLGADVPACVLGAALRMTGTGETIEAVKRLPKLGIVVVNPLIPCPTGKVYQRFDEIGPSAELCLSPLPDISTAATLLDYLRVTPNDLEAPAMALVPQIGLVLAALGDTQHVLLARMSGSGATCFGLYATFSDAQAAARVIKNTLASFPIWVEADEIN